ncbi:MAG: sigma-70 family RNA polymerase sigma factor [Gemmatales bacterium]
MMNRLLQQASALQGKDSDPPLATLRQMDEQSFESIMQRHGPMVLSIARRYVHDEYLSQDVFQAVFLVFWQRAKHLHTPENLANWFFGVTRRIAQRARQQKYRRAQREQVSIDADEVPAQRAFSLELLIHQEELLILDKEVARLPVHEQTVILLCVYQGLTRQQAARRLRCPPGTVAGRLDRARQRLARRLARQGVLATLLFTSFADAKAISVPSHSLIQSTLHLAIPSLRLTTTIPFTILFLTHGASTMMWKPIVLSVVTISILAGCLASGWAASESESVLAPVSVQQSSAALDGIWKVKSNVFNGKPEVTHPGYGELKAIVIQGKYWRHLYSPANGTRQFATTFEIDQTKTPWQIKMPQCYKWALLKQDGDTLQLAISMVQEHWPQGLESDQDCWRMELQRVSKLDPSWHTTVAQLLLIQADELRSKSMKEDKLLAIKSERLDEAVVLFGQSVRNTASVPVLNDAAQRLLAATLSLCTTNEERQLALREHLDRLKTLEQRLDEKKESTTSLRLQRLETEQQLVELEQAGKK